MTSRRHHPFPRTVLACLLMAAFVLPAFAQSLEENTTAPLPRSDHDIIFMSAGALARAIRDGELTSVQVVDAFLKQIETYNPKLNAVVTLNADAARKRAAEADAALARGEDWGPLHGVPITIKDNYATKGLRTTNGYAPLMDFVPDFDATVVERMRQAGAIILGKTNLPDLGMDYQTNSTAFGVTNNPWDLKRTPGGSSGGSAAAVAAGLTPMDMGNDLGGSLRIPAHFCGVYSLKPTENMVSGFGVNAGLPQKEYNSVRHLVGFGPIARSIPDLRLALTLIAGPDQKVIDVPRIPLIAPHPKPLNTLRVAWTDDFGGVPVTAETRNALKNFAADLEARGCKVSKLNPPDFDFQDVWETYGRVVDMEFMVHLSAFRRFTMWIFGAPTRWEVPWLQMVYPIGYDDYMEALTRRDMLISRLETFLKQYDVWICPVSTTPAFPHIQPQMRFGAFVKYDDPVKVDDRELDYWVATGSYTTVFNITGSPVVVMPVGRTMDGMPIGAQLVGGRWRDMELLEVAEKLAAVAGPLRHPPGY